MKLLFYSYDEVQEVRMIRRIKIGLLLRTLENETFINIRVIVKVKGVMTSSLFQRESLPLYLNISRDSRRATIEKCRGIIRALMALHLASLQTVLIVSLEAASREETTTTSKIVFIWNTPSPHLFWYRKRFSDNWPYGQVNSTMIILLPSMNQMLGIKTFVRDGRENSLILMILSKWRERTRPSLYCV